MKLNAKLKGLATSAAALAFGAGLASADIVQLDDVIIDGSLCVGLDCVNGESFGFDTIRVKENNVRIHFQDTSNSASFPTNDWRLVANDSSNGGSNYLGIEDSNAGRIPFRVEAGARANALFVEDDGDIGIGTNTPVVNLHAVDGNTPTLRLEQDGSSGFTPQTYDVAANEANFFIRDVTNGSRLFFRAQPGAPENSIYIANSGNVGMGTAAPGEAMHLRGSDGGTSLLIEEVSGTGAGRGLLTLRNNGGSFITFDNTAAGTGDWFMTAEHNAPRRFNIVSTNGPSNGLFLSDDGTFQVGGNGSAGDGMLMDSSGNVSIGGTLTQNSDKNSKMAIEPVNVQDILTKVTSLDVSEWTYIADEETGVRHIGPMSQDFYALFGTGPSDTGISSLDTSGVALAAIQALSQRVEELEQELEELR